MATATKTNSAAKRKAGAPEPAPEIYQFESSSQFHEHAYARHWLIEYIFAVGEAGVIGGPRKCLKTHVALDAAISISSGRPFLGEFPVPEAQRVAVFYGETSYANLQDAARRIAASKRISLAKDCNILWSTKFPQLGREEACTKLTNSLKAEKVKVVLFDPLYLCLLDGAPHVDPGNLYAIGPVIRRLARSCLAAGATPIFVHANTKTASKTNSMRGSNEPPTLDDLSWSGIGEFARQWLLLARRTPYQVGSSTHELVMVAEGSAGHSGYWNVDIELGWMDSEFAGRRWEVRINSPAVKNRKRKPSTGYSLAGWDAADCGMAEWEEHEAKCEQRF